MADPIVIPCFCCKVCNSQFFGTAKVETPNTLYGRITVPYYKDRFEFDSNLTLSNDFKLYYWSAGSIFYDGYYVGQPILPGLNNRLPSSTISGISVDCTYSGPFGGPNTNTCPSTLIMVKLLIHLFNLGKVEE